MNRLIPNADRNALVCEILAVAGREQTKTRTAASVNTNISEVIEIYKGLIQPT